MFQIFTAGWLWLNVSISHIARSRYVLFCFVYSCVNIQELALDHVFGYRGFDCRNNLHYLNDGADIIFHTAAAAVIQSLSAGTEPRLLFENPNTVALKQFPCNTSSHCCVVITPTHLSLDDASCLSCVNECLISVGMGRYAPAFMNPGVCWPLVDFQGSAGLDLWPFSHLPNSYIIEDDK